MRILIHGINFSPELTGIGKYTGEIAEWLAARGHEVRVVTAPPYYPQWKVMEKSLNMWRREFCGAEFHSYARNCQAKDNFDTQEFYDGSLVIYRCPLWVPAMPSGLKRIVHLASFALSSFPMMLWQVIWRPDVVWVVEPPLFCAPQSWLVARFSGALAWLHVQDLEVDAAFDLGIISFPWMKRMVVGAERWLMRRFDVVSSISQSMLSRLKEKGVALPVFFPNWSDLSVMRFDPEGRAALRGQWGAGDACVCLYSGNISVKQGLEILLEVAAELSDCRFVICGDGAYREALQAQAKARGLRNIVFMPLQPLDKLPALLSAADIHLVTQTRGATDLVMPSKLTNILAVGGVALVTAEAVSELGRLADRDSACVFRCDPEDATALSNAITRLANDAGLRSDLSERALAYAVAHIDKRQVLGEFECKLQSYVS